MPPREGKAVFVPPGKGKLLKVLGESITCLVTSDETNGVHSVVEEVTPLQQGPPLHVHQLEDEMFYVLEGECEMRCGDQTFWQRKAHWQSFPGTSLMASETLEPVRAESW